MKLGLSGLYEALYLYKWGCTAALAGIQERGQVLEVDLSQVPSQISGRSTHTLERSTA
jgi:hypothetical protein